MKIVETWRAEFTPRERALLKHFKNNGWELRWDDLILEEHEEEYNVFTKMGLAESCDGTQYISEWGKSLFNRYPKAISKTTRCRHNQPSAQKSGDLVESLKRHKTEETE